MANRESVAPVLGYGALDRTHLTKHLLALAQRVGVDKVTMRGLATEAGTSASSVYYHVKGKTEMLDLLIETVVSSIEVPSDGDWEQRIIALYSNGWRAMIAVPGISGLLQRRPITSTGATLDSASRAILNGSSLSADDVAKAHTVLFTHLLGSVELKHSCEKTGAAVDFGDAPDAVYLYGLRVILAGLRNS